MITVIYMLGTGIIYRGTQDLQVWWGVGINVNKFIPLLNRTLLKVEGGIAESVFIEIDKQIFNRYRNITTGVIYRPPGGNLHNFIESMNTVLNGLIHENML